MIITDNAHDVEARILRADLDRITAQPTDIAIPGKICIICGGRGQHLNCTPRRAAR